MNAVKHGKATHLIITTNILKTMTLLVIKDNGIGFDTSKKFSGFGLTSMRDRALELPHGVFDITSKLGNGTQLSISWGNEK